MDGIVVVGMVRTLKLIASFLLVSVCLSNYFSDIPSVGEST